MMSSWYGILSIRMNNIRKHFHHTQLQHIEKSNNKETSSTGQGLNDRVPPALRLIREQIVKEFQTLSVTLPS
jgi:hypothetical protein